MKMTTKFATRLAALTTVVASCNTPGPAASKLQLDASDHATAEHRHQIDRIGNVEVTNFILCFRPIKILGVTQPSFIGRQVNFQCPEFMVEKLKNSYNQDDAFAITPAHRSVYEKWFRIGLKQLDGMDSYEKAPYDWPHLETGGGDHPFVGLFTNSDWLLVDTTKPCNTAPGNSSYLDIQMSAYYGRDGGHQTCGGRTPNDDVIDTTLTLFMNGPKRMPKGWWGQDTQGARRGDGVSQAGQVAPTSFPWVAQSRPVKKSKPR